MVLDDNQIANGLKRYLETRRDQDSKNTYIGMKSYSIRELTEHVDKRTEIGKWLIELSKGVIEDVGEENWEKMLITSI